MSQDIEHENTMTTTRTTICLSLGERETDG